MIDTLGTDSPSGLIAKYFHGYAGQPPSPPNPTGTKTVSLDGSTDAFGCNAKQFGYLSGRELRPALGDEGAFSHLAN
jgi:hypothetical protein